MGEGQGAERVTHSGRVESDTCLNHQPGGQPARALQGL